MNDLSDSIVRKPWGWEKIVYSCPEFMVTLLHIVPGRGTSLHRHDRVGRKLKQSGIVC